jgi:hypothetical protein
MPGYASGAGSPPGYAGTFYAGPQAFAAGPHPTSAGFAQSTGPDPHAGSHGPEPHRHPKHDAHQYGQVMGLVNDLANGNADPSRVMAVLGNLDAQFWKGALVGVGVTLLLTNTAVRNALAGTLSGIFGAFSQKTEETPSQSK